jgi:hypothetical protein
MNPPPIWQGGWEHATLLTMDSANYKLPQTTPATSLDEVGGMLSPKPLVYPEDLTAFYRDEINATRGGEKMGHLCLGLQQAYKSHTFFQACLMGHAGVGKSTELSRLVGQIENQFRPIRFSADLVLDPGNFQPLDVLLIMMIEVAEQTAEVVKPPPDARLQELWNWFAQETEVRERAINFASQAEAGGGLKSDSLWAKALGLFATLRGEIKFASTRKTEVVEHRLSRLDTLIAFANRLLDDCNELLRVADRQEWLFIGENFDKNYMSPTGVEDLFITYSNIFRSLRTHLIFSVPIGLFYSDKAKQLPFEDNLSFVIPDTPIYNQDHTPNEQGRAAVAEILSARMDLALFEPDQTTRLIVASGGNIRDLFSLVKYAALNALVRAAKTINSADVTSAIDNLRSNYERQLGQSPFDQDPIPYTEKAALLKRIYAGKEDAKIPSPVLYSLLSARAVQEFNGKRWFGVHPLVVDILINQQQLQPEIGNEVKGGTQ